MVSTYEQYLELRRQAGYDDGIAMIEEVWNGCDAPFVFQMLDKVHARRPITLLIEGGARGADRFGRAWAQSRGIEFKTCDANWNRYGNHAGRVRNCQMLREEKPQFVVAFEGKVGTPHMIRIAEEAGVPVLKTWNHKPTGR